jgi:hypothetical protein
MLWCQMQEDLPAFDETATENAPTGSSIGFSRC